MNDLIWRKSTCLYLPRYFIYYTSIFVLAKLHSIQSHTYIFVVQEIFRHGKGTKGEHYYLITTYLPTYN